MGEIAKKPLRQVGTVKELLINDMAKEQLSAVAAKHMSPERMMRLMANALRTTPQLAECEPLTLLGAMMTSASLGLEPNTPLGHAYLIPFKNRRKGVTEVQFIIGYKGMISLARRSGAVVNIHADVVYSGDEFSYEYGSNQHLTHRPQGKRENPLYAYCHAKLTDGEAFIVLPWEVIEETRNESQGYKTAIKYGKKDTPWIAHLHSMAKKTAVRRLFDELPISIEEVSDAVSLDEQRNDYRGFAFDPSAGAPMPEADGDTIDGEYVEGEDDGEEPSDEEKQAQHKAEKPAEKQQAEEKPKEGVKPNAGDAPKEHRKVADQIMEDLNDGAPVDGTLSFHAEALEKLKADAPDFHAELMQSIKQYESA